MPSREVPWLNVSGVWLEEARLDVGDAIEISVGTKELVIKKMKAVV
jgi:toxic protein SymE